MEVQKQDFDHYTAYGNVKSKMKNGNVGIGSTTHENASEYFFLIEVAEREVFVKNKKGSILVLVGVSFSYTESCELCSKIFNEVCDDFLQENPNREFFGLLYKNYDLVFNNNNHCSINFAFNGAINNLKSKLQKIN